MPKQFGVIICTAVLMVCIALTACSSANEKSSSASDSTNSSPSVLSDTVSTSTGEVGDLVAIEVDYSAGTGYEWTCKVEPEDMVTQLGRSTTSLSKEKNISGGSLRDTFSFQAEKPGEVVITFDLVRSWEGESAETQVYAFTISDDLKMTLNPYKSNFKNEPTWK